MPVQCLGYKLGQLEIGRLREQALTEKLFRLDCVPKRLDGF